MYKKQMCDEAIVFQLPKVMKKEAAEIAARDMIPLSELMRDALDAYLTKRRKNGVQS